MKKVALLLIVLLWGCASVQVKEDPVIKEDTPHAQQWNFHYEQLDPSMQNAYEKLYEGFCEYDKSVSLQDVSEEEVQTIFRSILEDHPQLFYVNTQYQYRIYADGSLCFYPMYDFDEKKSQMMLQQIDEICEEVIANAPKEEEDCAAYLYAYVIEHCAYGENDRDQQMDSFFLQGESVCAGYSKAYQYLMQKAGLYCTTVSGEWIDDSQSFANGNRSHAWNFISLGGDWFYVDTTSGDVIEYGPHVCYQFFMFSTQEGEQVYAPTQDLPQTKDPTQSYFQKHHLYLEEYDEQVLEEAIRQMNERKDGVLELRTKTNETEALKQSILKEDRIFHLFAQNGIPADTLGYVSFDALGMLEFYRIE